MVASFLGLMVFVSRASSGVAVAFSSLRSVPRTRVPGFFRAPVSSLLFVGFLVYGDSFVMLAPSSVVG